MAQAESEHKPPQQNQLKRPDQLTQQEIIWHRQQILSPDLFAMTVATPIVVYKTPTDPDRHIDDFIHTSYGAFPPRKAVVWSPVENASNAATGKAIVLKTTQQVPRQVQNPDGSTAQAMDTVQNGEPVATIQDVARYLVETQQPLNIMIKNAHLLLQEIGQKEQMVHLMRLIHERMQGQQKSLILQMPTYGEVPREMLDFVAIAKDTPIKPHEWQRFFGQVAANTGLDITAENARRMQDALTGLTLTQARQAFTQALVKRTSIGEHTIQAIKEYKSELLQQSGLWEPIDTSKEPPKLIGWERFTDYVENAFSYGAFEPNSPHGQTLHVLFGHAGTGKTTMAATLGHKLGIPVFKANMEAWMGNLMGDTEKGFARAMDEIRREGRAIALVDEAQRLLQAGDQQTGGGTMYRAVGKMLSSIEEMRQQGIPIIWLLTANQTDAASMPPELFSRGKVWAVPFPTAEQRVHIFASTWQRFAKRDPRMRYIPEIQQAFLAQVTAGMTGRDIEQLISTTVLTAHAKGHNQVLPEDFTEARQYIGTQEELNPEQVKRREQEFKRYTSVSYDTGGKQGQVDTSLPSYLSNPSTAGLNKGKVVTQDDLLRAKAANKTAGGDVINI